MSPTLDVKELAIVIAVRHQDPTLLNPEFLHYSGIIPETWELIDQPLRSAQGARIRFQNGVSVIADPQRTIFTEPYRTGTDDSQLVPGIAQRYTEILRNLELQAYGFNLQGFVPFPQSPDAAREYVTGQLLNNGPWHNMGNAPVQAQLNCRYQFDRNSLNLSVQEAALQLPEQQRVPIVIFSGNFETDLRSLKSAQRLTHLHHLFQTWPDDLTTYQQVVSQFLGTELQATESNAPAEEVRSVGPEQMTVTDAQSDAPVLVEA